MSPMIPKRRISATGAALPDMAEISRTPFGLSRLATQSGGSEVQLLRVIVRPLAFGYRLFVHAGTFGEPGGLVA